MSAEEAVEELLTRVTADRLETYEELLGALADSEVWMLLWQGAPGEPDAHYGGIELAGHGYAPCVTSAGQLTASGWNRAYEVLPGRDIAAALYPDHWGLWLNPHAPGGGLGVPWLDLRRIAGGLDRLPAGPLRISEPSVGVDTFYARLVALAQRTPVLRALWRAWVRPALGSSYLAIGLDVDGPPEHGADAVRAMMREAVVEVPDGLTVGTVAMADGYDPVAMWLRANTRPFYDRDAAGVGRAGDPDRLGYGYPGGY
ncbi:enhanced serine sensitivity protein SseB C-terminal domain-containing protein [Streptomyces sp. DSM 44915]|uniref:Enhanced serine sensitivity protein SseB C-terminal domain-containing protein n=1 Tax=Streptomyces chisholmiae TaxID=3075540 RepID=A0ABU2JWU6_9ACTN|nr:enhanced serine sensitivity protein SseB C-terminal domain-containing protein [Streptomyces sp. DSM 44915]MDT0269435.1 enhanced serine sensitivity protein SseB C-terminal domain-containing protein [Streptomyces sp. DSM 44915]